MNPKVNALSIDFECRSGVPIDLGLARYFADPEFAPLCMCWSFDDDEPPQLWTPGEELPAEVAAHIDAGGDVRAFNAAFEWQLWSRAMTPRYGWPTLRLAQMVDTMHEAAAMNLPQSLGRCAQALRLPQDKQKDARGSRLITLLCCPQPEPEVRSRELYKSEGAFKGAFTRHRNWLAKGGRWIDDPALLHELYEYCRQDVVTEIAVGKKLRRVSDYERRVWVATQEMNQRGVPIDVSDIGAITSIVKEETDRLNAEVAALTGGEVGAATETAALRKWINARHAKVKRSFYDASLGEAVEIEEDLLPDMQKETLDRALVMHGEQMEPPVKRAIQIRQAVGQTSTKKLDAMAERAAEDGTLKDMLVTHGAGTGRDASRGGVNVQNIVSPVEGIDIARAFELFGTGDYGLVRMMYGDQVMDAAVSLVRGVIRAPRGHVWFDADYSSIENRVAAWIAGQEDILEMFRQGVDEYKAFAVLMFKLKDIREVTKPQRKDAKPPVLGCLGASTPVLTRRGLVPLVRLRGTDELWDGVEWVTHCGVAFMGVKKVMGIGGVQITPDHRVLEGEKWMKAESVSLKSAHALAHGLLPAEAAMAVSTPRCCAANAGSSPSSRSTSCVPVGVTGAVTAETNVLSKRHARPRRTWSSFPTNDCESRGSTEGWRQSLAATIGTTLRFIGTAPEASPSATNGGNRLESFSSTSSRCLGGTTSTSSSIARTTTTAIAQAMFGWQRVRKTWPTPALRIGSSTTTASCLPGSSGASTARGTETPLPSREKFERGSAPSESLPGRRNVAVPTFDVLNAGPRSRFTIVTADGPLIVHNCMFGLGARGLIDYAAKMGVKMVIEEAERINKLYRSRYNKVQASWYRFGDVAVQAVENPGTWFDTGRKAHTDWRGSEQPALPFKRIAFLCHKNFLWMQLPSGRRIAWAMPRVEMQMTPWGKLKPVITAEQVDSITHQWVRDKVIGSSFFQSSVQATARDLLIHGFFNLLDAGYDVRMRVHDQLVSLVPHGFGSLEEYSQLLCDNPPWCPDIPLACEAQAKDRFDK